MLALAVVVLAVSFAPHANAQQCQQRTTGYCAAAGAACAPPAGGKCEVAYGQPPFRRPHCVCVAKNISTSPSLQCKQSCRAQFDRCEHRPQVVGQVAKCQRALQQCDKTCG